MGRATNTVHRQDRDSDEEERPKVPRMSMDYFYMSKEDEDEKNNSTLVALNEPTNEKYARAAGQTGIGTE